MRSLSTEQLRQLRATGERVMLVNVLEPTEHQRQHIPESLNLPLSGADFVQRAEKAVKDKKCKVIVYCSGPTSDACQRAAMRLEAAGYTDVCTYEGGMRAWCDAGQPVVCM